MKSKTMIYSYSACSTCKKALNWLREHNLDFELVDIVQCPPSKETLKSALSKLGERKALFNTRGVSYRALGAKVVQTMSDKECIEALSLDGKLIKRPFLILPSGDVLLGFNPDVWASALIN